jgi:hypothetical protein
MRWYIGRSAESRSHSKEYAKQAAITETKQASATVA